MTRPSSAWTAPTPSRRRSAAHAAAVHAAAWMTLLLLAIPTTSAFAQGDAESPADFAPFGAAPYDLAPQALALATPIGAPCAAVGGEVRLAGVGNARFDRIELDGDSGDARLWGGVCIDATIVGAVLRAEEVRIFDLEGDPRLQVEDAVLDLGAWRLAVRRLNGSVTALTLTEVHLLAPGLIGSAEAGSISADGAELSGAVLATDAWLFQAERITVAAEVITLHAPVAVPCRCDRPRYHLSGSEARVRFEGGDATLLRPALHAASLRLPLGDRFDLVGGELDTAVPLRIRADRNLGTVVEWHARDARGPRLTLGTVSEPSRGPLLDLQIEGDGANVRLQHDPRGPVLTASQRHELHPRLAVTGFSEANLRGARALLRSGAHLSASTPRASLPLGGTDGLVLSAQLRATLGAELAAEPVSDGGLGPAGPRFPASLTAELRLPLAAAGRLALDAELEGAFTPGTLPPIPAEAGAWRGSYTLRPSYQVSVPVAGSELRFSAAYLRHAPLGVGPFAFDAVSERSRLSGEATLAGKPFGVTEATASLRAEWRLAPEPPGPQRLGASASVTVPLGSGFRLQASLASELAGLIGGPDGADWWQAGLNLQGGADLQADARVRFGVTDGVLRDADLAARVPIDLPVNANDPNALQGVRLAPYLAADFAPWLRGEGPPTLSAHGLRVRIVDCCGTVTLGYLRDGDGTAFEVGVSLPDLWRDGRPPEGPVDPGDLPEDWPDRYGDEP